MDTKRFLFALMAALVLLPASLTAQTADPSKDQNREQWFEEMRQYKHNFLVKELNLTPEQQSRFFPIYDEMEDQTQRLADETRIMKRRLSDSTDEITDLEYEKATDAIYEQKLKEAQIEMDYYQKFKPILSKKQLFQLKEAERQFQRNIMSRHHKLRTGAAKK